MRRFRLDRVVWGHSRIDASEQTRFFLHFEAHVVARHRATALHLLRTVVPSQRWGVARVRPDGWRLYFKGGWGSGSGLVDHQVALLRCGRAPRRGRGADHRATPTTRTPSRRCAACSRACCAGSAPGTS